MTTATITKARQQLREQSSEQVARFSRVYATGARQLDGLTNQGISRLNRLLRELRFDIRSKLAQLTGGLDDPFTVRIVPTIAEEINESLLAFTRGANNELAASLSDAFGLGSSITSRALSSIGIPLGAPAISPQLLASLIGTTEDVMIEMTNRLGQRIMGQVRLAAVGLEPTSAVMNSIDNILRTSEEVRRGVRRRIGFGFQAEAITRTEVGRVFSVAQQAAGEQISESIPDLRKQWVTRSKERRGHLRAERKYATDGITGPIPIKQRFIVQDFSRTGTTSFLTLGKRIQPPQGPLPGQRVVKTRTYRRRGRVFTDRMLFPRDPSASAGNVVNCTCVVVEFLPEIEEAVQRTLGVIQRGGDPIPS